MNTAAPAVDDRRAKRNVAVLFFTQAILGAQLPVNIILGGLAGALLADNRALATLPISVMVLLSMFSTLPVSHFMGRFGRKAGFLVGAVAGAIGGMLSTRALLIESFELLLLGAAFTGVYQSTQGYFRFAAADTASPAFKPKAISWVLAGGLLSALIGPEIVRSMGDYFAPVPYAGAYATIVLVNIIGACGIFFLDIPRPPQRAQGAPSGRPLIEILCQPRTVVAIVCAMISYAMMALVMTSTPLAMTDHGFTSNHAADVVRWHVLAMFAPSFITGSLIARFGHVRIIALGLVALGVCSAIALTGTDLHQFYLALVALGLGWNFGFIGGTSLLTTTHTIEEQAKVQGLNDFLVLGLVTAASFSSGALLSLFGWNTVQLAMTPALFVAAAALVWLTTSERRAPRTSPRCLE
ncbi:MAG: MFS transporter [Gammaproteobacteria bacterium]|nr:MFS transporter [Gammaproteobacteria bacterium]MDH3505924.1 MFS transporter [Gammaproteobacteria bacterium]